MLEDQFKINKKDEANRDNKRKDNNSIQITIHITYLSGSKRDPFFSATTRF